MYQSAKLRFDVFIECKHINKIVLFSSNKHEQQKNYQFLYALKCKEPSLTFTFRNVYGGDPIPLEFDEVFIEENNLTKWSFDPKKSFNLTYLHVAKFGVFDWDSQGWLEEFILECLVTGDWMSLGHDYFVCSPKLFTRGYKIPYEICTVIDVSKQYVHLFTKIEKLSVCYAICSKEQIDLYLRFLGIVANSTCTLKGYCLRAIWKSNSLDRQKKSPLLQHFKEINVFLQNNPDPPNFKMYGGCR